MKQTEMIRRFNRAYTSELNLLNTHVLETQWTFPEGRIIGAVGRSPGITANEIRMTGNIDKGYLSRILHSMEQKGLLRMECDQQDHRKRHLFLTDQGKNAYDLLEKRSDEQVFAMYAGFTSEEMKQITDAMELYLRKKEDVNVHNR